LFFSAAMGAVAIIASSLAIKREWRVEVNERFDILGAIYYALSIFCVIYGFSLIPNPKSWPLFLFGAFMVVMFIRHENRNSDPLFNLRLFSSNYNFRMSTVASMLNYAVTGALTFILSLYLQTVRGLDAQDAGMLLMIQPIAQTVLSVYSGRLSDKMNPAILATAGMAVICVGMVGLCFVGETTPWWFFVSIILCFGVGFGTFSSPNVNLIMSSVEKQYYGTASAVTGTARQIGQSFSIGIATLCLHIYLGNNIISPANRDDFMSSFHLTCVISLVMCVIGVYASATRIWRGNS
jgi:MFS family permease